MRRITADSPFPRARARLLPALVFVLAAGFGCSPPPVEPTADVVYPGASWERIADPASAGFSAEALDAIHPYVDGINTTAVMAVVGGRVLFEHGPVESISYLASVRKSILAMLYGRYVEDGTIDLEATLEDLGMDDVEGLLPIEKQARVLDLVTARSGVYHPASNSGDNLADAPPRGSQEPGTYYLYSNWDFNAAGAVFEQRTERNIYDALGSDLALPLGFEDWHRWIHRKSGDATRSHNLAYHMNLSTRDMARIGYLMLRDGVWKDERVLPEGWAGRISGLVTPSEEMNPESRRVRLRVHVVGLGRPGGPGGVRGRLHRTRSLGPVHHRHPVTRHGRRAQDRAPGRHAVGRLRGDPHASRRRPLRRRLLTAGCGAAAGVTTSGLRPNRA